MKNKFFKFTVLTIHTRYTNTECMCTKSLCRADYYYADSVLMKRPINIDDKLRDMDTGATQRMRR